MEGTEQWCSIGLEIRGSVKAGRSIRLPSANKSPLQQKDFMVSRKLVRRNRKLCVAIAQDVLAQIRLKRFKATPGTYVEVQFEEEDDDKYAAAMSASFQQYFKANKKTKCQVCALGAAFVSLVNIENKCSVENMMYNLKDLFERLERHFGQLNMGLMECAFERSSSNSRSYEYELIDMAVKWGSQYDDDTERLQAIMRNVIRNNGDFKLPKKYIARAKTLQKENASW